MQRSPYVLRGRSGLRVLRSCFRPDALCTAPVVQNLVSELVDGDEADAAADRLDDGLARCAVGRVLDGLERDELERDAAGAADASRAASTRPALGSGAARRQRLNDADAARRRTGRSPVTRDVQPGKRALDAPRAKRRLRSTPARDRRVAPPSRSPRGRAAQGPVVVPEADARRPVAAIPPAMTISAATQTPAMTPDARPERITALRATARLPSYSDQPGARMRAPDTDSPTARS